MLAIAVDSKLIERSTPLGSAGAKAIPKLIRKRLENDSNDSRAARRGGGFKRGASRSGLVCPFLSFLSFLGLSRFFWDFPDLLGDGPGIFPICPFPLSWPIKSTYEEQSRKAPRHNLDLSRKKWETPGFGNPPV